MPTERNIMKTTKTYATLAGAYTAAEKAGATRFTVTCLDTAVVSLLAHTYKHTIKRTLAKWNLVKFENTLCALDCTNTEDGKATYKWTAIGHFDSDGLLYSVAPKTNIVDKLTKRTRKAKGEAKSTKAEWQTDLDAHAGKGRQANKTVASILRKHKMSTQIGTEGWTYWESIR
jgi:hypothetical protein